MLIAYIDRVITLFEHLAGTVYRHTLAGYSGRTQIEYIGRTDRIQRARQNTPKEYTGRIVFY